MGDIEAARSGPVPGQLARVPAAISRRRALGPNEGDGHLDTF